MKTKLLKKVRERYSIEYHPNTEWRQPTIYVKDTHKKTPLRTIYIETEEERVHRLEFVLRGYWGTYGAPRLLEEAKIDAYNFLVRHIRDEYLNTSSRRKRLEKERKVKEKQDEANREAAEIQRREDAERKRKESVQKLWYK